MTTAALMSKASSAFYKAGFQLKKHSPEILVVTGVIGTVVSAVMACKATTKVSDILEETKETIDIIHEGAEKGEIRGKEYTQEDAQMVAPASTGYAVGSLSDYFGLPTGVPGYSHSSLFHRASPGVEGFV